MNDRIRTTISLSPDVYDIFKGMADASGLSVSRCMGDWLEQTSEGAELISSEILRVRGYSNKLLTDLHASMKARGAIASFTTEKDEMVRAVRQASAGARSAPAVSAPSSNTGLKSTGSGKSSGRKGS